MSVKLKIALVTDWLTNLGGAEKVVAAVAELYPEAPIYTTFLNYKKVQSHFPDRARIHPSRYDKIPLVSHRQMTIAPFLKSAVGSLDLSKYDLILSFSSSVAKNIRIKKGQIHICYIHTPARYIWQKEEDNRFEKFPKVIRPFVNLYLERLKKWDLEGNKTVHYFIANSSETVRRVKKFYNRDATMLYPPVDFERFEVCEDGNRKDYFFAFGRFVKYKKFDLLVEAFAQMPNRQLLLGGDGPEKAALEAKVKALGVSNINFLGRLPFSVLKKYLAQAKALLLPQKEDAGIVQLEAFASGVPVIAYGEGGVLDVLEEGVNGMTFEAQTPESLISALERFETISFDSRLIRGTAENYSTKKFQKNFQQFVGNFTK
ncbi:glycosyltransferase [Candidatus Gracilibacteria bacterium]|nr:glycosyltransferase [Candidatus Gracilibacteria bacterium]